MTSAKGRGGRPPASSLWLTTLLTIVGLKLL
jgi:hypothetical protein